MWIHEYSQQDNNPYTQSPFVQIKCLGYIDNLPVWTYPFHNHPADFELAFITEGEGSVELHSRSVPLTEGDLVIIPPGVMHHMAAPEGRNMRYCTLGFHLQTDGCSESVQQSSSGAAGISVPDPAGIPASPAFYSNALSGMPISDNSFPDSSSSDTSLHDSRLSLEEFFSGLGIARTSASACYSYIRDTFHLLFNLHQHNGGKADETMQTVALGLLQLARQLFTNKAMQVRLDDNFSAADIMNYIMETSGKGITLESLADHFHVSQSHLSRIFCKAYHVSPINYAILARVTSATEYLMKSDLPVNEIASLCGYDNPVHFTNMFVKRIGCTPAEYRERNRKIPFSEGGEPPYVLNESDKT